MKRTTVSKSRVIAGHITTALLAASLTGCALDNTAFRVKSTTLLGGTAQWQALFAEGKEDLRADRLGLAIDKLQAALAKKPNSVEIMNAVGVAYDRLGRHELAQVYFERALALAPDSTQTLNNIGYSLSLQGKYEEAVSYLQRAALRPGETAFSDIVTRNYRIAVNKLRVASARNQPPAPQQAATVGASPCPSNSIWIERTTARVHTLITKPSPEARAALARLSDGQRNANPAQSCIAALRDTLTVMPPISETTAPLRVAVLKTGVSRPVMAREASGIEVSNGAGRRHLAARMRTYFGTVGQRVVRLSNARHFKFSTTVIFYRKGHADTARRIAGLMPFHVRLQEARQLTNDIQVRLGHDALEFDTNILMKKEKV